MTEPIRVPSLPARAKRYLEQEPRAPEYARLINEYECNGAGYARGDRLHSILSDALRTVKRLEVEMYEVRHE